MNQPMPPLDLARIRELLGGERGRDYWRSLEEIAGTEEFEELLHREFPRQASEWTDASGRRNFLKLMAASLSLAGLGACTRQPTETIMPYVQPPEEAIPGRPLFYATAVPVGGIAQGVLVESHLGRPTKIEGNPDHPASLGATDVISQGSVLSLYDPDRSQTINYRGDIRNWGSFLGMLQTALDGHRKDGGARFRILTETIASPTLAAQMRDVLALYPAAKWTQYDPCGGHSARAASMLAFGEPVSTYYRFDAADVILSLGSDFLACGPASTRYAHDFASRRRVRSGNLSMNRLYVVETAMTSTGGKADHRLPLRAAQMESFARALYSALGGAATAGSGGPFDAVAGAWIRALAADLQNHRGASIVIPGEEQPPEVHVLAHALNDALGNNGKTVIHTQPVEANPMDQIGSLRELIGEMNAGKVELLIIAGGNPVYNAPADFKFRDSLSHVPMRIHLSPYEDETSEYCDWHIPETHHLETWSDARAYDGTVTILQPLIAPLYEGHSAHELLAAIAGNPGRSGYDIVREHWMAQTPSDNFESWWARSVHDGIVANSALAAKPVSLKPLASLSTPAAASTNGHIEVAFRPDAYLYDGRYANNGWLQELPRPITKLAWDNAVLLSPATAQRLGVRTNDVVELKQGGQSVTGAVYVAPGQANESATVHLGYGRRRTGRTGNGAGFNAYPIRTSGGLWFAPNVEIRRTGSTFPLASTQMHYSMEGRDLIASASIDEYKKDPSFAQPKEAEARNPLSLYQPWEYTSYAWGMAIDLTACVNCNACVIACQAENNIPVVGKRQVLARRAMHWLRVDTYYKGSADNPAVYYQPVPCMHCEDAPCELVCPVQATNHSSEGLNDMVYNRCVGTRYCSNNCPYKVRRFNFFLYSDWNTESLKLQKNPDVTVRSRGVMEKCSYCVQRIREAHIDAEKADRKIQDGEIKTACQQVCPTQAIIFGNINDRSSAVSKMKAESLNYALLADLNTRPRTTYLAELRNPNPAIERSSS